MTYSASNSPGELNLRFVIVGVQKGGSTWLYETLRSSDQICMPTKIKETNFFLNNYSRGMEWYFSLFDRKDLICGEASPEYITSALALRRLAADFPDVKIIVVLRRPFERSIAHYKHLVRTRNIPHNFKKATVKYPEILCWSFYEDQLSLLFDVFDKKNISIQIFENLIKNPHESINSIASFIGVDSAILPSDSKYKFYLPKYPNVYSFLRQGAAVLRKLGFYSVVSKYKNTIVDGIGVRNGTSIEISQNDLHELKEYLANHEDYVKSLFLDNSDFWF